MKRHSVAGIVVAGVAAVLMDWTLAGQAWAQGPDQLVPVVVPGGVLSSSLAAYGYDPITNTMYLNAFGNPAIVRVSDVGQPTQSFQTMVSETQLQLFYVSGDRNRSAPAPSPGSLLLNPKAIGGQPAYSFGVITDQVRITQSGGGAVDPALSKRLYAYNLQALPPASQTYEVLTSRVTLADMQAATGATNTSTFTGRQPAFSGDGQSVYFTETNAAFQGVWKTPALGGPVSRIFAEDYSNSEPGVLRVNDADRIYFAGGGSTGNIGGIDFITHDGTTTSSRQVAVSVATLNDFFQVSGTMPSQRIGSVAFSGSTMYFAFYNNASSAKAEFTFPGIYQVDAQGRIAKVVAKTERSAVMPGANLVFDRLQPRDITYTGTAGSFTATQVLYRESGAQTVAGAIAFKPGDFNRDNVVTSADIDLFRPQVTSSGTANVKANVADLKFDMNGNNVVSWKDVQILGQFLDYVPDPTLAGRVIPDLTIEADTNLDGLVDFADFRIMRDNYAPGTGNRAFTVGDSSGDDRVDFADLQPWVNSQGYRSAVVGVGVPTTPFNQTEFNAFLATLTPPDVVLDVASGTSTQFQKGYRSIVIAANVTKTGSGALVYDGQNTYTGTTTIAAGSLIVDPAGTFGTSSLVDVRTDATLDVSRVAGGQVVAAGQTLGGSGTVVGSVVFGRGSTLSPGATSSAVTLQSGPALPPVGSLSTEMMVVPEPAGGVLVALAALAGVGTGAAMRRRSRRPFPSPSMRRRP